MNSNLKAVKTGRKGDPRMHRAVSARLANPELSLFDALRLGGFEYAADEDASIVDCEKVTLGQRKNQLSRRLRLARKTQDDGEEQPELDMNDVAANERNRASAGIMSSEAQKQLEKLMQHSHTAKLTSGVKRTNLDMSMGEENDDDLWEAENRARRMAKFHPQYQPLFIPRAAAMKGGFSGPAPAMTPTLGSLTPNLRPLAAPLGGLAMGGGVGLGGMLPPAPAPQPSLFQQGGFLSQAMRQPRRNNSSPSGVAVASLTATAQSVGLTLEQLALSLTSSTNLMKILSNSSDSEQHQEVALRLFKNESKALYQRCMLLAGFKPEEADENSQAHLNFAFNAWQEEGKRLQELMGEVKTGMNNCTNGQAVCINQTNFERPRKQSQEDDQKDQVFVQQNGHRLSIGSSQAHCDDDEQACGSGLGGHHVHEIDGKCGHMPIVHKPEDGEAHIDFVVGNKVECYHGVEPVSSSDKRLWRSKLKCEDMNCPPKCNLKNNSFMGDMLSNSEDDSPKPKVLDIGEINLQGKEWNLDLTGPINGGVLGLFKLGDTKQQPNVTNQTNPAMRRMSTNGSIMVNNPNSNTMTVLQI